MWLEQQKLSSKRGGRPWGITLLLQIAVFIGSLPAAPHATTLDHRIWSPPRSSPAVGRLRLDPASGAVLCRANRGALLHPHDLPGVLCTGQGNRGFSAPRLFLRGGAADDDSSEDRGAARTKKRKRRKRRGGSTKGDPTEDEGDGFSGEDDLKEEEEEAESSDVEGHNVRWRDFFPEMPEEAEVRA
ncbi:hypothetical protein T484DRAFT_1788432 [Baffinella frigidus]|nr:hypothetical protein T484DRAFT_1788432 [Cryptophyta sp. CCMP2293]